MMTDQDSSALKKKANCIKQEEEIKKQDSSTEDSTAKDQEITVKIVAKAKAVAKAKGKDKARKISYEGAQPPIPLKWLGQQQRVETCQLQPNCQNSNMSHGTLSQAFTENLLQATNCQWQGVRANCQSGPN
jgi:hypothetical protein